MRFTLNLATRTYINSRQVNLQLGGVGIVLLALLVWNTSVVLSNSARQKELEYRRLRRKAPYDLHPRTVFDRVYLYPART